MMFSDVLDAQVHLLQTLLKTFQFMITSPIEFLKEGIQNVIPRMWREVEQQTIEKQRQRELRHAIALGEERKRRTLEATAAREQAPQMNFPNARFDITQKFAEGFDPDRIALAFTQDLAALGERRLSSGFQPVYAMPMR
jgi:glycine/D-amino acid oxidase-like deaminating enzyme